MITYPNIVLVMLDYIILMIVAQYLILIMLDYHFSKQMPLVNPN